VVGYAGGVEDHPTYKNIKDYTETVRVIYDPRILSYRDILYHFEQRGGLKPFTNKIKRQYRKAILVHNKEQMNMAELFINKHNAYHVQIENCTAFYRAEEYHQKYKAKKLLKHRSDSNKATNFCRLN
jgi:peptide-methionine (S)-S-oxide reductase